MRVQQKLSCPRVALCAWASAAAHGRCHCFALYYCTHYRLAPSLCCMREDEERFVVVRCAPLKRAGCTCCSPSSVSGHVLFDIFLPAWIAQLLRIAHYACAAWRAFCSDMPPVYQMHHICIAGRKAFLAAQQYAHHTCSASTLVKQWLARKTIMVTCHGG